MVKKRILVVDDEPAMTTLISLNLERAGCYEVRTENLALKALDAAREFHPDLIMLDVIMPGMDGPTLLKAARVYLGDAPVMFISGYAEAEFSDLLEGEANISFLPKPIDIKTLAERVKQQLQGA